MVTLQLKELGARYGSSTALQHVNTPVFHAGQMVAVIGPNAAGKSTLFKRVAGMLKGPGEVLLQGSRKGPDGICYMPQDISANARLTVYESILLAAKQQHQGWAVTDAELAQVGAIAASLGIAELAFRNLGELSGGQRQLVSIAQTLARDPEILLMDEPTSALDLHRQIQVLDFMRALARERGLIVFIALHDLNQALRYCDHALVIANGQAQRSGPCGQVITADMLREVYRIKARIESCSQGTPLVIVDGVA
jgi:iron complex transport system ATP-binding protein